MRSVLRGVNLVLRVVMEVGVIAGFAYWGYQSATAGGTRVLLAILAPLVGFGFWGLVDFRQSGKMGEPLRLLQELLISGMASAGLYIAGKPVLGIALAAISLVHHSLVYLLGDRLLKR